MSLYEPMESIHTHAETHTANLCSEILTGLQYFYWHCQTIDFVFLCLSASTGYDHNK